MRCRRAARVEHSYTPQELIKIITKTACELGRTPARRELGLIAYKCVAKFGSWNNAIAAAHLPINRSHSHRMYKRTFAKAEDGHLCDSLSECIIDNWLHRHNIKHERNYRYPIGNYRADWGIIVNGGTIFIEYFGLVNDSPRYDRSIKRKQELCAHHKIRLVEIYPKDLYPVPRLDKHLTSILKL